MSRFTKIIVFILFISLHSANSNAAEQPEDIPPLVLEHAERLINRVVGDEIVKELIDDVLITRGDMSVECHHALLYERAEKIIFKRDVHYSDSLRDLWADRVVYYIDTDRMDAFGSVRILQDVYQINCQRAEYSDRREDVYLYDNVHLFELEENIELTGERGFGDKILEYIWVTDDAHLVQKDSTGGDKFTIDACKMEFFHAESRAQATDSVRIQQDDIIGYCQILQYFRGDEKALMQVDPIVVRDLEEMRSDSIYIYFQEEKINRIELYGHASAVSPAEFKEGEFNQIYGGEIFIQLKDEELDNIWVRENARSIYFLVQKEDPQGANSVSGDRMKLFFTEGELEIIQVIGGVEGVYYPEQYQGVIE